MENWWEEAFTNKWTVIKEKVRCNVVHIGVIPNVGLDKQRDEQVCTRGEKENNIEGDEDEEDFVHHCCWAGCVLEHAKRL